MTNRQRAEAWVKERGLTNAPWAGVSHVTALTALLDEQEQRRSLIVESCPHNGCNGGPCLLLPH